MRTRAARKLTDIATIPRAAEVAALTAYAAAHPGTALVEPLPAMRCAVDRGAACELLAQMPPALRAGGGEHAPLSAPPFALLASWDAAHVAAELEGAQASRVLCGIALLMLLRSCAQPPASACRAC